MKFKIITTSIFSCLASICFAQVETTVLEQPFSLQADGKVIDVKQVGHAAPCLYDYNKDGKLDLLVGYFGKERLATDQIRPGHCLTEGGCNIYLNKGANENPEYTYTGKVQTDGRMAYVPCDCCVGFVPHVADLDGDGIGDLLSGSFPGQAYFFKGLGTGMYAPFEFLHDKNGKALNPGHTTTVVPFDWDADGDLDLVWGVRFKGVFLSKNEGTATKPVFTEPVKIETQSYTEGREKLSSNTVPADWDNDGLFDLICGTESGDVIFYKNSGKKGQPDFSSKPEILILNKHDHSGAKEGDKRPHGYRTKVFVHDYNGDGKMDLLVGDMYSTKETIKELSPKDLATKKALEEKAYAGYEKNQEFMAKYYEYTSKEQKRLMQENPDLTDTEASGLAWNNMPEEMLKAYQKYTEESKKVWEFMDEYRTEKHHSHGYVWVYLRK